MGKGLWYKVLFPRDLPVCFGRERRKEKGKGKNGQNVLNSQNSFMKWGLYLSEGGRGMPRGMG